MTTPPPITLAEIEELEKNVRSFDESKLDGWFFPINRKVLPSLLASARRLLEIESQMRHIDSNYMAEMPIGQIAYGVPGCEESIASYAKACGWKAPGEP